MNRAEWIEQAIDKALGKRPRHTLQTRLAKLEQKVKELARRLRPYSCPCDFAIRQPSNYQPKE